MKKSRPQEAQEAEEQARLVLFELAMSQDGSLKFYLGEISDVQMLIVAEGLRVAADELHEFVRAKALGGDPDE